MQGNYGDASMPVMQPANAGYYTAKKNLPCPYEGCDKLFTCNHNITQHIRESHTGERPYQCELCEAQGKFVAFSRPASKFRHQRMVHNFQPDVGPRGRRPGAQGPRRNRRGVGRNDAAIPVVPLPSDNRINVSNDPNSIDPRLLQQMPMAEAPDADYCFTCRTAIPGGLEARLMHGHLAHNDECNPSCSCPLCVQHFSQQVQEQQFQTQQPSRPRIVTHGIRNLNNSLLNQPLPAKQPPPAIEQPKPIRTLDLSTLNALDEKLRQVEALQSPRPGPSRRISIKSSATSDAQDAKAEVEAARPDSGIGFDQDFEMGGLTDYAAMDFKFEDFANEDQSDGNVAAGGVVD